MSKTPLLDSLGRRATYMRMSVTDRCNFACVYCVNSQRQGYIPHERVLRYEEFARLARIGQSLGVEKIRITGGEPFARRGLADFMASLRGQMPDMRLCITTNGDLLAPWLDDLASIGISSFNISLDSFDASTFARLSGGGSLSRVLGNMEGLLARGQRVKINAVALRGISDAQIHSYLDIISRYPIDLRFIEFMPMGSNTMWSRERFISWRELHDLAARHAALAEAPQTDMMAGPAKMYDVEGAKGRLGFISAVSEHFCSICNRLRITSDGNLRACLFSDREYPLAPLLRHPRITDASIARAMHAVIRKKPLGRDLLASHADTCVAARQMVGIGG